MSGRGGQLTAGHRIIPDVAYSQFSVATTKRWHATLFERWPLTIYIEPELPRN